MPAEPGQMLSHYRLIEKIGAGGMGVVWKAVDTRLDREVAIKILPEDFASNQERLARFEREAKVLASLNHPNVATLHGFEQADDTRFLVMEFVEGEELAARLRRGPVAVQEALPLFLQIAEGLEAAHENGVIHRDLKPANVKISDDGRVKILDFGLAKALEAEPSSADRAASPTVTSAGTVAGVILGTAAYMSPEQARGRPLDKRTDIWSFGCMLYEALTGQSAFAGETVSDSIAKILEREPDWDALPVDTPSEIRTLARRCMRKDPMRRQRDMGDVRVAIEDSRAHLSAPVDATPASSVPEDRHQMLPWAITALMTVVAAVLVWSWNTNRSPSTAGSSVTRLVIALPPDQRLVSAFSSALALSPDGRHLVYAAEHEGNSRLYLREMDRFTAMPIPDTDGARGPFFSPDGQWVGFFAGGTMKKVAIAGGTPSKICEVPTFPAVPGASWGPDDTIVYSPHPGATLWKVPAEGGKPQELTTSGESHRWPHVLPGGTGVLYTATSAEEGVRIAVLSTETGESHILLPGGSGARYLPTGHLVFAQSGKLLAVPFDLDRLEVSGAPVPVLDGLSTRTTAGVHTAPYAVSDTGTLVYVGGDIATGETTLVWVDRQGQTTPFIAQRSNYRYPRISPDGSRVAVAHGKPGRRDIWIYDAVRGTRERLTVVGNNNLPVWSPSGTRIAFASNRSGGMNPHWRSADRSDEAERLSTSEHQQLPISWSSDGRTLAFYEVNPATGRDIWILPLEGDRTPRPFLATSFSERAPTISPNGRWLAYVSNESGQDEVLVQPYPDGGGKTTISTSGGAEPVWSADGRELFYRQADQMWAVTVEFEPRFIAGKPQLLFDEPGFMLGPVGNANYDVSPDGRRRASV